MGFLDFIKEALGKGDTVEINGMTLNAYPLTYEEYLEAIMMLPPPNMTEEDILEFQTTNKLDEQKQIAKLLLHEKNNENTKRWFEYQMFIIEKSLNRIKEKDGLFPDLDMNVIKSDVRLFHMFTPLFEKVWAISEAPPDLKKKLPLE